MVEFGPAVLEKMVKILLTDGRQTKSDKLTFSLISGEQKLNKMTINKTPSYFQNTQLTYLMLFPKSIKFHRVYIILSNSQKYAPQNFQNKIHKDGKQLLYVGILKDKRPNS